MGDYRDLQVYIGTPNFSYALDNMFKSINLNHDCYFLSLLVRNADVHSLNTRNGNDYVLPLYNRSITQRCILFCAIKLWNGLPIQLKQLGSIGVFKKKITEMYLNL